MNAAELELITAAVDGELSATEARAFRALVARSAEARTTYEQLQAHSARLKALPAVAPPADLRARILAGIASATPAPRGKVRVDPTAEPARVHDAPQAHRYSWVPVAVAASVFLAIAGGSFAYFSDPGAKPTVAKNNWANTLPAPHEGVAAVPAPSAPQAVRPHPREQANVPPVPQIPNPRVAPHGPDALAVAPAPRGIDPDLIGYPLRPVLPSFERVDVRLPFLYPVADLGREDVQHELLAELRPGAALKFDVFVRDPARGVEAFQYAARAAGLTVHADAATLDRLKKRQVTAVAIYLDCLSAAEVAVLFARLSAEDAKFSPRVCDQVHAGPVVRGDDTELKGLLGADVGLFRRPANGAGQGGERPADPKPVSAGTIDSVVKSVGSPPAAKAPEKPAVLVGWQAALGAGRTNPATSAEIKQYLAKRGDRKPNTVPVLIVIRSVG